MSFLQNVHARNIFNVIIYIYDTQLFYKPGIIFILLSQSTTYGKFHIKFKNENVKYSNLSYYLLELQQKVKIDDIKN